MMERKFSRARINLNMITYLINGTCIAYKLGHMLQDYSSDKYTQIFTELICQDTEKGIFKVLKDMKIFGMYLVIYSKNSPFENGDTLN
jgi:hypothetical protein